MMTSGSFSLPTDFNVFYKGQGAPSNIFKHVMFKSIWLGLDLHVWCRYLVSYITPAGIVCDKYVIPTYEV